MLCVLGDLNGLVGDRLRVGIISGLGVPRENDNGWRVIDFCIKRGVNTYFEHRNLHKYTRVVKGQDGVEVKSTTDLVLVKKAMLSYVQDVRALRGMERGLSDLCKVRLVGMGLKRRVVVNGARRIRNE